MPGSHAEANVLTIRRLERDTDQLVALLDRVAPDRMHTRRDCVDHVRARRGAQAGSAIRIRGD
jgi:hypothetical protein